MIHKAWYSIEEVPYYFSRSSIKFQGPTGRKIYDLNPICVRLRGRWQLSNPSDLPCLLWIPDAAQCPGSIWGALNVGGRLGSCAGNFVSIIFPFHWLTRAYILGLWFLAFGEVLPHCFICIMNTRGFFHFSFIYDEVKCLYLSFCWYQLWFDFEGKSIEYSQNSNRI